MPTPPSMPRADDGTAALGKRVAIILGAVIILAALTFIALEVLKPPMHWLHLSIFFGILVFGGSLIVPDTSLRFLRGAKDLLVAIVPFARKPVTNETPTLPPSA